MEKPETEKQQAARWAQEKRDGHARVMRHLEVRAERKTAEDHAQLSRLMAHCGGINMRDLAAEPSISPVDGTHPPRPYQKD